MSLDLGLDHLTHDLGVTNADVGTFDLVLIAGSMRVRQQIEVTLLTLLGEWFLDTSWGVPYFDAILVKSPDRIRLESIIRAKVGDVPGVQAIPTVDISVDPKTRKGRISLPDIQTDEGLVTVETIQWPMA